MRSKRISLGIFTLQRWLASALALSLAACLVGCGAGILKTAQTGSTGSSVKSNSASQATLGYTMNATRVGLTSINGVPGASHLTAGIIGSGTFSAVATCVQQSFAVVATPPGAILLMSLPGGQTTHLSDGIATTQRVLLSPSCSSALVYAPDTASAILITGMPASPEAHSVTFGSGSIAGAAVGDSGSILFANPQSDGSVAVQIITAAGKQPQPVTVLQKYGAMTFLPAEDTAVLADSAANTVTVVSRVSSSPGFAQAATAQSGISNPLALATSSEGRFIFVANSGGLPILRLDRSGASAPLKISCSCTPTELLPLAGHAAFQLSEASSGTVFALDGDAVTPRTFFIPTDKKVAPAAGAQ